MSARADAARNQYSPTSGELSWVGEYPFTKPAAAALLSTKWITCRSARMDGQVARAKGPARISSCPMYVWREAHICKVDFGTTPRLKIVY